MASKVTFKVSWDNDPEKKSGLVVHQISCGDAEDIPVPLYMAILKAMLQVEEILNGKAEPPIESPDPQPTASKIEELKKLREAWSQMGKDLLRDEQAENPPPPPKTVVSNKPKRFTVEEKTEIAMMYADGQSIKTIAEKFGRTDTSIRLLVSKMGVKRGDDVLNPETPAAESEQPKEKKESVLKKPWYLQSQRTIPSKKEQ